MSSNTENNAFFKYPDIIIWQYNHIASSYCNLKQLQLKVSVKKCMLLFWIYKGSFFYPEPQNTLQTLSS